MKKAVLYLGAAAVGGVALYVLLKKRDGESLAGAAGRAAAEAVGDAGVGVVKGIGSFVGIPDTNMTQCQRDLAAGNHWDASFSCPASEFISGVWNGTAARADEVNDLRQVDRAIERQQAAMFNLGGVYDYSTGEQTGMYDEMGNRIY